MGKYQWTVLVPMVLAAPAMATTLDLTTAGASGDINGATFTQVPTQPTGTGFIGSFLRIQNTGVEQGYNTGGGTPFDDKGGISLHNGDVSVSDFLNNNACILLDINQDNAGTNSLLTLTSLKIFTSSTHNLTTTNISSLGTLQYDLGTGNSVLMDAALNHGSGSGDVTIDLPATIFASAASTDAVYVYASFSNGNGGFEEFALLSDCGNFPPGGGTGNPPPVPEPLAAMTLPLALAALGLRLRKNS